MGPRASRPVRLRYPSGDGGAAVGLEGLELIKRGKVRDMYRTEAGILMVATDRISAYDVVLPTPIPNKGAVLTGLSAHWFAETRDIVRNHLITTNADDFPPEAKRHAERLRGRSMLVRPAEVVPIECVARGYLSGSAWKEYRATGAVCGIALPGGLRESDRLPEPVFTPATKAEAGHDENVPFERACEIAGRETMETLRRDTLALYAFASERAEARGILIADTKFEFGSAGGEIILVDEALTPDSSRFWPAAEYAPGTAQPSFDKQYVRDWLDSTGWDHTPPGPELPDEVVARTREKYVEAYERLSGRRFAEWLGE
ncbi:MAG: phosphoribosylaminoimidazolesuccinocarboxamide synthase [Acidobacteria bacterium]|nr:phosphoribosylaminoimidazolesuccinocarboxamide synthase [Acidobacteriota bacterium]